MKKNFITVFAIGLSLIACKKEPVLNNDNTPEEGTEYIQEYIVPVSVSVSGEVSKAFYDESLSVKWEENDQILAMKGKITAPTSNGTVTHKTTEGDHLLTLSDLRESTAEFEGKITTAYEGNAIWHFVYPASAGSMETSCKRTGALGVYSYSNTTTVNIAVPGEQNGVWIPYSYCASANVSDDALLAQSIAFRPLSACYAVRLFEEDGTTPKKAKKVTLISAVNNLVGSFAGTTTENGQTAIPAAITTFTFNGTGNTIEANVEGVAAKQDGVYEYRINVPAGNLGELTLQITDENDAVITRSIPAFDLAAGHMKAFKVKWNPEGDDTNVEFLSIADPKTTYDYYLDENIEKANGAGMANKLFDGAVRFNATATQGVTVKEYGIKYLLDKSEFSLEDSDIVTLTSWKDQSGKTVTEPVSFDFSIDGISIGTHTFKYVAYVIANGSTFYSDVNTCDDVVITGLPYEEVPPQVAGWTGRKNVSNTTDSNESCLYSDNDWGASPYLVMKSDKAFNIPSEINVAISYRARVSNRDNRLTLSVQGNGTSRDLSPKYPSSNSTSKFDSGVFQTTMSPEYNYVGLYSNGGLNTKMWLYRMTIIYSAGE